MNYKFLWQLEAEDNQKLKYRVALAESELKKVVELSLNYSELLKDAKSRYEALERENLQLKLELANMTMTSYTALNIKGQKMKEKTVKIYARDLKEGDLFRVGFTDAVCSLNKISYAYGRVWVKINFYDGEENFCNISGHDEIYKIIS